MYNTRPGLLIGFHGCDKSRQQELLNDSSSIPISKEIFDWLGHGMYFWENNYDRAMEWAKEKQERKRIKEAAVIGAVIDLGHCCDLLDSSSINVVATYYRLMEIELKAAGRELPENRDLKNDEFKDKLMRDLDCATIEFMHEQIRKQYRRDISEQNHSKYKFFDSIRGVFPEGGPAYAGAGFKAKSHIQLCIRNANCIKGFFLKRDEIDFLAQELDHKIT